MRTAYDLLGIRPDADDETIKLAFREAAKLHHPDRRPGDPHAPFRFRQIATANAILRDPERRADYDQWLALERRHMRSERIHVIVAKAIDVGLFSTVLVIGSLWIVPVTTSERADRLERQVARGTIEAAAVPLAPRADAAGEEGALQASVPELVIKPRDAAIPPAVAAAEAVGTHGPTPDAPPNDAGSQRETPAAGSAEDLHPEIAFADATGQLGARDTKAEPRPGRAGDDVGDPDHALAVYDAAIRIVPDNPILFHDRGLMWRRKGDLNKALADLDRAIRFGFSDADFYNDRGLIWLEKGRYIRAIADFDRARQIDPSLVDASINRDIALRREIEAERRSAGVD
jgi:tetratricopeptide (TPR) repeat protein